MLNVHLLQSEPRVTLGAATPTIGADIEARVNEIWQHEKELRSHDLYNGRLFSIDYCDAKTIVGWISEYRYFLAQRREPSLYATLKINRSPSQVYYLVRMAFYSAGAAVALRWTPGAGSWCRQAALTTRQSGRPDR